jgi:hypothetical protein
MWSAFHFGVEGVVVRNPAEARKPGEEAPGEDDDRREIGALQV